MDGTSHIYTTTTKRMVLTQGHFQSQNGSTMRILRQHPAVIFMRTTSRLALALIRSSSESRTGYKFHVIIPSAVSLLTLPNTLFESVHTENAKYHSMCTSNISRRGTKQNCCCVLLLWFSVIPVFHFRFPRFQVN